ncbi:hypothetical protein SARC_11828 [Sphaeroforma arctica JP610]|uniref:Uncharacterized protein n=1 Tax=Sphaeroforma arctica JP610 TaxID=667725 RepID=A0A0L0FFY0_9EUKA|nr:hypothetical protein SARC_11828 [Sphaeroforma arctica JP610]KNC75650.1 hypothetical protein SARC_11828 [Sphaeroforma arctica JP610]|eukprot:XP_014149552.1 hypothetical protein SARC_11828 [Sphaeroforma arctica JP610]
MRVSTTSLYVALVALLYTGRSDAVSCDVAQQDESYACDDVYIFDLAKSANEVDSTAVYNNVCCKRDGCKLAIGGVILEVFRECAAGIGPRSPDKFYVDVYVKNLGGQILSNANLLLMNTLTGESIEFVYGGTTVFALDQGGNYEISVLGIENYIIQSEEGTNKDTTAVLTDDTVADGVYKLVNVSVDSVVNWVYAAPQLNREVVIRAEDDYGDVVSDAQVKVTFLDNGTTATYTTASPEWDGTSGTFIFSLPANSEYTFEMTNIPTGFVATGEFGGDNNPDGITTLTVSEDSTVRFVYSLDTTCQEAFFDAGSACPSGSVNKGWKACYGIECTASVCCGPRTCLTEIDPTKGTICGDLRPKANYSTIPCGTGTGVSCTKALCCTTEALPPKVPHVPDQCSSSYLNINFEDFTGVDDDDLDSSYRPEGVSFALTTTGSFTPYSLRSAPRIEAEGGKLTKAGFWTSCAGGGTVYDVDTKNTLGKWFLKLVGLDSDDIPYMPALLITYNTHGSTQAAGMLYDIDGSNSKKEQYMISIYDKDRNFLGSDFSIRGDTSVCSKNAYEGTYWQFIVNSPNNVPIKYLRIDYIGSGLPTSIGMGFDNFRAFGCTKDGRVLNAFTTGN